jgi:hypothetical protein
MTVSCPAGKTAIGGGFKRWIATNLGMLEWFIGAEGPAITSNRPKDDLSGWEIKAQRGSSFSDQGVRAYAICVYAP